MRLRPLFRHCPYLCSLFPLSPAGIDVNKTDDDGWTAVMYAALKSHTEVLRALLAAPDVDIGKAVTRGPHKGKTALGMAIHHNKPEATALLRAAAAEGGKPVVAVAAAAAGGGEAVIVLPIVAKAREAPAGTGQRIYDATKAGDVDALRPLVQEWIGNEDVLNWANPGLFENGCTPLIIGSQEGRLEAVELLLATPGEVW